MTIKTRVVNVRDFGAKGDYVRPQSDPEVLGTGTDDSLAFKAAIQFILNNTFRSSHWGHPTSYYSLYIPAGQYYITQPESLIPSTYTTPTMSGLKIYGDGAGAGTTEIIYNPPTAGTALMSDNNGFSFMTVENISFTSVGDLGGGFPTLNNTFLKSYSNGEAQHITFRNCFWGGGWKYLWHIVGTDTDSEWSWYNCGVSGGVESAFYIPPNDAGLSVTTRGSDQFVNYNFFGCNFEVNRGNYIRADAGGSINLWGGSIINTSGTGGGDGTTNNTVFKLGLARASTNDGAYRLLVQGVRFEMRGATNNKIIECDWPFGVVTFISCDMAVHNWIAAEATHNTGIFNFKSDGGPVVQFISCLMEGRHEYKYNNQNWQKRSKVLYQGCQFPNYNMAEDFIVMTALDANSEGSAPMIEFNNCRGGNSKYFTDQSLNWHLSAYGEPQRRILKLSNANNEWPLASGPLEVYLPKNSLITAIRAYTPAGETASTTTGWHHFVKTSEGSPTTLADITPISDNPSLGHNQLVSLSPPFFCNTDAKRHLTFAGNANVNTTPTGYLLIEYIA